MLEQLKNKPHNGTCSIHSGPCSSRGKEKKSCSLSSFPSLFIWSKLPYTKALLLDRVGFSQILFSMVGRMCNEETHFFPPPKPRRLSLNRSVRFDLVSCELVSILPWYGDTSLSNMGSLARSFMNSFVVPWS